MGVAYPYLSSGSLFEHWVKQVVKAGDQTVTAVYSSRHSKLLNPVWHYYIQQS